MGRDVRFAKVPEWLPGALLELKREKGDAAPAVAVMAFVVLAARADFVTWRVPVCLPDLAAALGQSERTARRAIDLLERAGAATVADGWATLAVENRATGVTTGHRRDSGVNPSDTGVTDPATGVTADPPKAAGQGTFPATPQTELLSENKDASQDRESVHQPPLMALVRDLEKQPRYTPTYVECEHVPPPDAFRGAGAVDRLRAAGRAARRAGAPDPREGPGSGEAGTGTGRDPEATTEARG